MENVDSQLSPKGEIVKGKESQLPRITYQFFFAPHATAADAQGLQEIFDKADIFIPEDSNWTQRGLDNMRKIAAGKHKGKAALVPSDYDPYIRMLGQMLYNSQKPTTFVDTPKGFENEYIKIEPDWTGNFSDMLSSTKRDIENYSRYQKKREQYMLDHLEPRIRELLEEYPLLKEKKELKVLLSLGSVHSLMYDKLLKSGVQAERFLRHSVTSFSFRAEGLRCCLLNKEITDGLAAKIFLERLFVVLSGDIITTVTDDTQKQGKVWRKIANEFSFEDAEKLFKSSKKGHPENAIKFLQEKGIRLPQSEKEVDEFLGQPLSHPKPSPEPKWPFWRHKK